MPLAALADRPDKRSASAGATPAPAARGDQRPAGGGTDAAAESSRPAVIRPGSAALAGPGSEPRRRAELVRRELRAHYHRIAR